MLRRLIARRAALSATLGCGIGLAVLVGCSGTANTPAFGEGDGGPGSGQDNGEHSTATGNPGSSGGATGSSSGSGDNGGAGNPGATGSSGGGAGGSGADAGSAPGSSSGAGAGASSGGGASGSSGPGGGTGSSSSGAGTGGGRDAGARADASARAEAGTSTSVDAGSVAPGDGGAFDQFQQHNLDVVNGYRTQAGLKPYVLDATLSAFALAGSVELSMDHMAHQHFKDASSNNTLFTAASGFKSSAGENQGDPNGWTVTSMDPTTNELTQIDQIQAAMFAEGPSGGHYQNQMSTTFTRMGVGLLEVSGKLYLTNDFSN